MIDDYRGYVIDEFIERIGQEIYDATKPKTDDRFTYHICMKDQFSLVEYRKEEFNTYEEAEDFVKRIAKVHETDESGKNHYYNEYTLHRGDKESIEREEFVIFSSENGYYPEYDKETIKEMKKCLKKIREAKVCADNIVRLFNYDCDEDTFVRDNRKELEELKHKKVFDKEYFKRLEDEEDIDD